MSGDSGNIIGYDARNGARAKIRAVLADIRHNGFSKMQPFSIGRVERRMQDYASQNDITLASKSVYMSSHSIAHSTRDNKKTKGLAPSDKDLIDFPIKRRSMDLFYDGDKFVYTDYRTKFIVHPNYELKIKGIKTQKVNFVTAGKVTNPSEFRLPKYKKIK